MGSSIILNRVSCPICEVDQTNHLFAIKQDLFKFNSADSWETNIVQCKTCGLIFNNPQPHGIDIYESEKYANKFEISQEAIDVSYLRVDELLDVMPDCVSVVDLGAGAGQFVKAAKDKIKDVSALEINPHSIEQLELIGGIDVINCSFDEFNPKNKYDCVTAYDVIEHLSDPSSIVEKAGEILRVGGVLVVVTQNSDYVSYPDELLNHCEHFWQFNQQNLRLLMEEYGFKVIDVRYNEAKVRKSIIPNYLMSMYAIKK